MYRVCDALSSRQFVFVFRATPTAGESHYWCIGTRLPTPESELVLLALLSAHLSCSADALHVDPCDESDHRGSVRILVAAVHMETIDTTIIW